MTNDERREQIRGKLIAGDLPNHLPANQFGGPSEGQVCAVCDGFIGAQQTEIEFLAVGYRQLYFHPLCALALVDELQALKQSSLIVTLTNGMDAPSFLTASKCQTGNS